MIPDIDKDTDFIGFRGVFAVICQGLLLYFVYKVRVIGISQCFPQSDVEVYITCSQLSTPIIRTLRQTYFIEPYIETALTFIPAVVAFRYCAIS
jgi:hypothetical protein